MFILGALEAEKLQKTKCPKYQWTPCTLSQETILDYLRQLSQTYNILGNYQSIFLTTILENLVLYILGQSLIISMTILCNYKDSFATATTTANKSMLFDPDAINLIYYHYQSQTFEEKSNSNRQKKTCKKGSKGHICTKKYK